jgi:hypothetical protein
LQGTDGLTTAEVAGKDDKKETVTLDVAGWPVKR